MKRGDGVVAVKVLGLLACALVGCALVGCEGDSRPAFGETAVDPDPPTTVVTDPAEVFQRAFWKRPADGDRILHAERREWADGAGVRKWQWFLVVEPSGQLVRHLREDNAFSLVPAGAASPVPDAPEWFSVPTSRVEVLRAPGGEMQLVFVDSGARLYAADSGAGFSPGAPTSVPQRAAGTAPPGHGSAPSTPDSHSP